MAQASAVLTSIVAVVSALLHAQALPHTHLPFTLIVVTIVVLTHSKSMPAALLEVAIVGGTLCKGLAAQTMVDATCPLQQHGRKAVNRTAASGSMDISVVTLDLQQTANCDMFWLVMLSLMHGRAQHIYDACFTLWLQQPSGNRDAFVRLTLIEAPRWCSIKGQATKVPLCF